MRTWFTLAVLASSLGLALLVPPRSMVGAGHFGMARRPESGPGKAIALSIPLQEPADKDPALLVDLCGAMLEAGLGVLRCLEILAGIAGPSHRPAITMLRTSLTLGSSWSDAIRSVQPVPAGLEPLFRHLGFALQTGASVSGSLYASAFGVRRRRAREAQLAAAALGVRLVVPLGLCTLPSFVCLGVMPVVLALIPGIL